MQCYVLEEEPSEATYAALIDFCVSIASKMVLVVRDPQRSPGPAIEGALALLGDSLESVKLSREWPGTILLSDEASVHWFRVSVDLGEKLKRQVGSLFEWVHPELPEDPCFFREDGEVLLVTTSHEQEAYLLLKPTEVEVLASQCPDLMQLLRRE